jgi:hypothetical protein
MQTPLAGRTCLDTSPAARPLPISFSAPSPALALSLSFSSAFCLEDAHVVQPHTWPGTLRAAHSHAPGPRTMWVTHL